MTQPAPYLSGTSGEVSGIRAVGRALALDLRDSLIRGLRLEPWRLARAARSGPRRRVLAVSVVHDDRPTLIDAAVSELRRSRHELEFVAGPVGSRGKFENLNELLAGRDLEPIDWLLVIDDDVRLPRGFLDRFLFCCERFALDLAQPAHRRRSHAAWAITRRRPGAVVRESRFVEIGPVTAFARTTWSSLLPFPPLRYGWGLDVHWSALAAERGWRLGIVDATPISHGLRRIASGYGREAAEREAQEFLAARPFVSRQQAQTVVATHRSWR